MDKKPIDPTDRKSVAYERYLLNQPSFDKALEEKYRHQTNLAVKDRYNFDFHELGEEYDERKLELGLVMSSLLTCCYTIND